MHINIFKQNTCLFHVPTDMSLKLSQVLNVMSKTFEHCVSIFTSNSVFTCEMWKRKTIFVCLVFILVIAVIKKDFQNVWVKTKLSLKL